MTELQGLVVGTKLAVFSAIVVYSYLAHVASESYDMRFLILGSLSFVAMAAVEFLSVLTTGGVLNISFLADIQSKTVTMDALYLAAGISMVVFLYRLEEALD